MTCITSGEETRQVTVCISLTACQLLRTVSSGDSGVLEGEIRGSPRGLIAGVDVE